MHSSATAQRPAAINIPPLPCLILGGALLIAAEMRWGIGLLAWVAPVPLFYYLARGGRHLWLFVTLLIALNLAVAKIITPPLSYGFVPMFAVPAALGTWFSYWIWGMVRQRAGAAWALYTFPAIVVVLEWLQPNFSPLGVWGGLANTQLENLVLLQTAALFGTAGIAFLMSWAAVLLAEMLIAGRVWPWRSHLIAFAIAMVAAYGYGSVRLYNYQPGPQLLVATVASNLVISGPAQMPAEAQLRAFDESLLQRSEQAAKQGARLIVWNEVASVVGREQEPQLVERVRTLARNYQTHIVMAYGVLLSTEPFLFENKYQWIRPDGSTAETYLKHHPVPGEGSIKGEAPLRVIETDFGKVAGAICYDYDFPAMAREHGRLGAGLVVLPSSDWRGIDPIHTQMTRVRAIEGGFSLLRSVRAAASAGFDGYGRVRGWSNYFERADGIMLTSLPTTPVVTLYRVAGDLLVYLCIVLLAVVGVVVWKERGHDAR